MGESVFGAEYARQYDLLYRDKDYRAECDMLTEVFHRYGDGRVQTVLDLGCGTGNHAFPLAQRGYQVTGVDRSEGMMAQARAKAEALGPSRRSPVFLQADLRALRLERRFDAVLMMFAVLGYQLSNEDVLAALQTVRHHLRAGGLFVCDIWYGPAVLTIRPGERVKVIPDGETRVARAASATLDSFRHLAMVHYRVTQYRGEKMLVESEETHPVRYFFPQELAFFMSQAGLEMLDMRAFDDLAATPSEERWNALVIGRAASTA